jgi:hypothetical protein
VSGQFWQSGKIVGTHDIPALNRLLIIGGEGGGNGSDLGCRDILTTLMEMFVVLKMFQIHFSRKKSMKLFIPRGRYID